MKFQRTEQTPLNARGEPLPPRMVYTDPDKIFAIERFSKNSETPWFIWHINSGLKLGVCTKTLAAAKHAVTSIRQRSLPVDWSQSTPETIFKNKEDALTVLAFVREFNRT